MARILSIFTAVCLVIVANAAGLDCIQDAANPLQARQGSSCNANSGYFSRCAKCCQTLGAAGCYRPIRGSSTGSWDCYATPPGAVVGTYTDSTTRTSTRTYVPTSTPAITPGPSTTSSDDYYSSSRSYSSGSSRGSSYVSSTCSRAGWPMCADGAFCAPSTAWCFYNSLGSSAWAYSPRTTMTTSSFGLDGKYTGSTVVDLEASRTAGIVPTLNGPSLELVSSSSSSSPFAHPTSGSSGYGSVSGSTSGARSSVAGESSIMRAVRWLTFFLGLAAWV